MTIRHNQTTSAERVDWSARGAYWAKSAPQGRATDDSLNQLIINEADIRSGMNVIDLASGAGDPAISIALEVGADGHVTALDASAEMLAGAKARAQNLQLSNMSFEVGRMEDLPFGDDAFDAVTCRFGLMLCDDPQTAAAEARRVVKPGRHAVFMVHGPVARNTLYPAVRAAVFAYFGEHDTDGGSHRFKFSEAGALKAIFDGAGFAHVEERLNETTQIRPATNTDGTPVWQAMLMRSFGPKIESLDAAGRRDLDAEIAKALAPYLHGDAYEFLSSERLVRATK